MTDKPTPRHQAHESDAHAASHAGGRLPELSIKAIQSLIAKVRRRLIAVIGGTWLAKFVSVLLIGFVTIALIDYMIRLDSVLRLLLLAAAIATLLYAAWVKLITRLIQQPTDLQIAAMVEANQRDLLDSLTSAVAFSGAQHPAGATAFESRTTELAAQGIAGIHPSEIVSATKLKHAVARLAIIGGAFCLLAWWAGPDHRAAAMGRVLTPLSSINWPKRVIIAESKAMPLRVAAGEKLDVRVSISRGNSASLKPRIVVMLDGREISSEIAQRREDGTFGISLDTRLAPDAADGSTLALKVIAGDDERFLGTTQIVPRLAIRTAQATITPPAYAQSSTRSQDALRQPISAVERSSIRLEVVFSKQLDSSAAVELIPAGLPAQPIDGQAATTPSLPAIRWRIDGSVLSGEIDVSDTQPSTHRFRIKATDQHGLTNLATEDFTLSVVPDRSPTVSLVQPARSESRTVDSILPLVVQSDDDFGLSDLAIEVRHLASKQMWSWPMASVDGGAQSAPLAAEDGTELEVQAIATGQRFRASRLQPLSPAGARDLKLVPGDVLELVARAQDNFDVDGQRHPPVRSSAIRILIVSQEQLSAEVSDALRTASRQLQSIARSQSLLESETKTTAAELAAAGKLPAGSDVALSRLASTQGQLADQTRQIAEDVASQMARLAENRSTDVDLATAAKDAAAALREAAAGSMPESRAALNDARAADGDSTTAAAEQQRGLASAASAQQLAQQQIARAIARLGSVGSLEQTIASMQALLGKQQELSAETRDLARQTIGRSLEQLTPDQKRKLQDNAQAQEQLSRQTQQLLQQMDKQAQQLAGSDSAASAAMKQSASTVRQQQVGQNQSKAAQSLDKNQQSSAQSSQRQAEGGLQLALAQLQEAQKRKLEELNRRLAALAEQIDNLIRRQAGHNILTARLAKTDIPAATREELQAVAGELPAEVAAVQVTQSQETTERNTRSIATEAGSSDGGGEIASGLTSAASRMERAIGLLRASAFADAYDPSQVQALSFLREARKLVQQQQEDAQQRQSQQQRQELVAELKAIREDQSGINSDTVKLDATPRDAQGALARAQRIAAGQAATRQGVVSERIAKLSEQLLKLNSSVFTFSARDIASRMASVKERLAAGDVTRPTQSEQARIISRIDAMVRAMDIKPPDPKDFEDRASASGGSGSGSKGPKLPSEAEMRLLREMQAIVNDETKLVESLRQKDDQTERAAKEAAELQRSVRQALADSIKMASSGQAELPPEPDVARLLPEESGDAAQPDGLDDDLLKADPEKPTGSDDADITKRVADRMGRSRQRLAGPADTGSVTQLIQTRIMEDLDRLVAEARERDRQEQQRQRSQPSQKQEIAKGGQPKPDGQAGGNPGQSSSNQSTNAASDSSLADGGVPSINQGGDIRQTAREWGGLSPRQRQAVIDGSSDAVVEKYRAMVEDYYRALAERSTDRK